MTATAFPPVRFVCRDGRTIETFVRRDRIDTGVSTRRAWGWRVRRSGRVVTTNGQAIQRYRAIDQAAQAAGPGARREVWDGQKWRRP